MNTLKNILTALTFSIVSFAFTASATPIDMWDWEVDSAFSDFLPGTVIGSAENSWWNAPSTLSWGNNNSALILGGDNGHYDGQGLASGALALTSTLTHHNFVINGGALTQTRLNTKLKLSPANTPLIGAIPPLVFDIIFKETTNNESCSYEGDLINGEITHCEDDIFVIDQFGIDTGGGIEYNPFTNTFNQQLGLGMYTYNVALMLDKLAQLPEAVCDRVDGASSTCVGVTTHERSDNTFQVHMMITQVPEPSTILLMSFALFGIVASIRTKHI